MAGNVGNIGAIGSTNGRTLDGTDMSVVPLIEPWTYAKDYNLKRI